MCSVRDHQRGVRGGEDGEREVHPGLHQQRLRRRHQRSACQGTCKQGVRRDVLDIRHPIILSDIWQMSGKIAVRYPVSS